MKKISTAKITGISLLCLLIGSMMLIADVGVIVPSNIQDTPDPDILSMKHLGVTITIDGQYARVQVLQIYQSRHEVDLEGKYVFTLPEGSQISDFAIWEDGVRIPGIIVEKKRAREIYEELTFMKIDPGLAESGGIDNRNVFSVEIYPIPSYGTKRVELEYTMPLPVTSLKSYFVLPLKPVLYDKFSAANFEMNLKIKGSAKIKNFNASAKSMPLEFSQQTDSEIVGSFSAKNFDFVEDFSFEYETDIEKSYFWIDTFRDTDAKTDLGPFGGGKSTIDSDGYFAATSIFNIRGNTFSTAPKDVVLLVDTSLSMQWDKLERTYEALEFFLKKLPREDRFALLTFNEEVKAYRNTMSSADEESVTGALEFFRNGYLMSGTDVLGALETAIAKFGRLEDERDRYFVLISDGAPTAKELRYSQIAAAFKSANTAGIKLMVFGIGNDSNITLLKTLASESGGYFTWASETESLEFKLTTFFDKLGEQVVTGLQLMFDNSANFKDVYSSSSAAIYDRSSIEYLGRYVEPGQATISLSGQAGEQAVSMSKAVSLPDKDLDHPTLPRRWAKLRVDHLLMQIELTDDNDKAEEMIAEVIALAKKYKFVTPYTSFLAAPRALLRPRAIKPGDPILRVFTDTAIQSVVARFPFGLTKPLHYIEEEDVWETRFLAPKSMQDGTYECRLFLTDEEGNLYEEKKNFIIDSHPPEVRVELNKDAYQPGEEITFKVFADQDTRSIKIRVGELLPVEARYRTADAASIARVKLPEHFAAGTYTVRVSAVDFARNTTVHEFPIEITVR